MNTVTVVNAYRCLEDEGLIFKQVGSGSFVAPRKALTGGATVVQEDTELRQLTVSEAAYNFASGTPTTDLFPVARFKDVLNRCWTGTWARPSDITILRAIIPSAAPYRFYWQGRG